MIGRGEGVPSRPRRPGVSPVPVVSRPGTASTLPFRSGDPPLIGGTERVSWRELEDGDAILGPRDGAGVDELVDGVAELLVVDGEATTQLGARERC